jgi:hypothetical protein
MVPFLCPGHDVEMLTLKVATSTLAAGLDEQALSALQAIVCGPLCFSFVGRCSRADRPEFVAVLKRIRVPKLVAWSWLRGLVEAGHGEDVLASLDLAGLLACWELYSGLCVTLTPYAARALGLELLELREDDPTAERWALARDRRDRIRRPFPVRDPEALLNLVDDAPGPVENAMDAERWKRGRKAILDEWNDRPRLVLGGFPIMRETRPRRRKADKKKRRRRKAAV